MRIDLLITELDVGGAEKIMASLAVHLQRQGHDVRLIALGTRPQPDRDRLVRYLEGQGLYPIFLNGKRSVQLIQIASKLRKVVRNDLPDVALSFLFHANVLAAACYPSRKVPLAIGVRVADPSKPRALLSRLIYRRCAKIICVSQYVARHIAKLDHAPLDKICVITNGVQAVNELNQSQAILATEVENLMQRRGGFLLFVGRFTSQKQVDWIFDLVRLRANDFTQAVVFIGDGPLATEVQKLALDYPARVVNLGQRDDVDTWLDACDLLLLPSAYEGMPNAALEAMAHGKPLATTLVDGLIELLGDNATNQAVSPKDKAAWLSLSVKLANDPTLRKSLGSLNRTRVRQQFNLNSKLLEYDELLAELAKSKK